MVEYLYHGLQNRDMRRLSSFLFRLERWMWTPRTLSMVEYLYHGLQKRDTRRLSSFSFRLDIESLSRPYQPIIHGGISTFNTI
jgi:hypothetical protein